MTSLRPRLLRQSRESVVPSILRLGWAVDAYRSGASLARLSASAGYSDRSHFTRESRSVTGEAPRRSFDAGDHC